MTYTWVLYKKPDASFLCNGALAGLVAITAGCAYVAPAAAVLIGAVAGVLVIGSCLFVERVLKIDDPVGAISVHGVNGAWGVLALGLFADGTHGDGLNGVAGNVAGLFYGNPGQLAAEADRPGGQPALGAAGHADLLAGGPPLRRPARHPDGGAARSGRAGAGHARLPRRGRPVAGEPLPRHRPAAGQPAAGPGQVVHVRVDGIDQGLMRKIWSDHCQIGDKPAAAEFKAVYPYMTTVRDNRFRFRGGDPETMRASLERLFREGAWGSPVKASVEEA